MNAKVPFRSGLVAATLLSGLLIAGSRATAQDVRFQNVIVGDRRVELHWNKAPGDTLSSEDRKNCALICQDCCEEARFGGYQIWRSLENDPGRMVLLRTYSLLDTTWTLKGNDRVFVDPDSIIVRGCGGLPGIGGVDNCNKLESQTIAPFNGFPYYYAVTYFESEIDTLFGTARIVETPVQTQAQGILAQPVIPAAAARTDAPLLGEVLVVPNPFDPSDEFRRASFGNENRVRFIHLPYPATVRIYTVAGDHVVTLENKTPNDSLDWDLRNGNGEDVKGGIYVFVAETGDGKQQRSGHFVIIR